MKCNVTITDTLGGEANYGWVNRYGFDLPNEASQRTITYYAKKATGMTNVKADTYDYGESLTIKLVASLTLGFAFATTIHNRSKMLVVALAIDHIHSRIMTIVRVKTTFVIPTHSSLSLSLLLISTSIA